MPDLLAVKTSSAVGKLNFGNCIVWDDYKFRTRSFQGTSARISLGLKSWSKRTAYSEKFVGGGLHSSRFLFTAEAQRLQLFIDLALLPDCFNFGLSMDSFHCLTSRCSIQDYVWLLGS